MGLILARSPFFVNNQGFDEGAVLTIDIGHYVDVAGDLEFTIDKTYSINYRKQTDMDISPLLRSSLLAVNANLVRTTVSGEISEVEQSDVIEEHLFVNGWFNYEDGYNFDIASDLENNAFYAGSNDVIYTSDDESLRVPLLMNLLDPVGEYQTKISFFNKNTLVTETTTNYSFAEANLGGGTRWYTDPENRLHIASSSVSLNFKDRVESDEGILESESCLRSAFANNQLEGGIDKVVITTIQPSGVSTPATVKVLKVVPVSECRYEPYRVTFKNKLGCDEDLWFFKRSDTTLTVEKETYRSNTFDSYKSGDLTNHVYKDFNLNGKERISLNTGYIPESFYENFSQLNLSQEVWIYKDNEKLPVNVLNEELKERLHVNEKLVNYSIELQYSFEKIGNIV